MHAEHAYGGALIPGASIRHVLQVEGTGDRAIARVAAAQRGVVHRAQLLAAGVGRGAIEHRLAKGSLYSIHPGVYAVGHPALAPLAAEVAALLHAGRDSLLAADSAARLWGLTVRGRHDDVAVILVGRHLRRRPGVRFHQVGRLDPRDVRLRMGIPVTAPARTMIDLAGSDSGDASSDAMEAILAEAQVLGRLRDRDLVAAMDRAPRRAGVARIRAILAGEGLPAMTRSTGERRFLRLIRAAELPAPAVNARRHGFLIDFLWQPSNVAVEVDGHRFHRDRRSFESDRKRDQVLAAAGYVVLRVTWRQMVREPLAVVARIAQALALHSGR